MDLYEKNQRERTLGRREFLATATAGLAALLGYPSMRAEDYKPKERDVTSLIPSSNYHNHEGKRTVEEIVLHTTESKGSSAENTFKNAESKVSAHYLVMEDGEVVQVVKEEHIAYHCKKRNEKSIGIEIAGYHDKNISDAQIKAVVYLIDQLKVKYKLEDNSIKAHSELDPSRRKDPGNENMDTILKAVKAYQTKEKK